MKTSASNIFVAIRLPACLLLVFYIAGCSPTAEPKGIWGKLWGIEVGPDYKRPEVKPVEDFRSQNRAVRGDLARRPRLVAGV